MAKKIAAATGGSPVESRDARILRLQHQLQFAQTPTRRAAAMRELQALGLGPKRGAK